MTSEELASELKLTHGFLAIKRLTENEFQAAALTAKGCTLAMLKQALAGETLHLTAEHLSCPGAKAGFGFSDELPNVPGGVGYFLSYGRGEGYPPGERVKSSPEVGEQMMQNQPRGVMTGFAGICVQPYTTGEVADTVTTLVTMDQLAALIHLFAFRKISYDNVIAPMVSGCASVFRLPFGELTRAEPRAVIGNIDVFSRPHFPAETAFFTVSSSDFSTMLADAEESMLISPIWTGVQARL